MSKIENLPGKWTLILTRPNGGVVGPFGDPWERCPDEFPRVNVYSHPPESALSQDQVRQILQANGMDPADYERARDLLRQAAQAAITLATPSAPIPTQAVPAERVESVNEVSVVPAEVVTPFHAEPAVPVEVVRPFDAATPSVEESPVPAHASQEQDAVSNSQCAPVQTALF
jgi:hypothetical protein